MLVRWNLYRGLAAWVGLAALLTLSACSTSVAPLPYETIPPPTTTSIQPGAKSIVGVASWYGPGFDGHRTSTGSIYDQEEMTAASELFAPGSRVMVTNLNNGKSVEVTITDHGPYKKGRKIDLSHKAAAVIGMIGPGTARVRIDLVSAPAGSRPVGSMPEFFVQVGSFSNQAHALSVRNRIAAYFNDVRINQVDAGANRYYRVRMGAFASRHEAEARAADTSRLGIHVVIVCE
ncbi:MAG TPA: septal ring lytic transglycosylase RlpA family protein [Candidatus Binataceae bacterium]|nr:septal ring lytic transglycosylase RlpA family protein [Candidatus Binataceae bacterium]